MAFKVHEFKHECEDIINMSKAANVTLQLRSDDQWQLSTYVGTSGGSTFGLKFCPWCREPLPTFAELQNATEVKI